MNTKFRSTAGAAALFPLLAGLAAAVHADASRPADRSVGEITMSVGPVVKTNAQGLTERVTRGSVIHPGDRLDTAEGGHVHIRFVDGALVSVRPGSRLTVQDYKYDPQHVADSVVRFKLEYGVARAISGAAAEGAKDRFRLNTPLVAIGVRGTDFVVRAGEHESSAAVNQGAIIMAPLGEGCTAQALGPCASAAARLLSADMGRMLVEFQPQLGHPELKPLQATAFATHMEQGNVAGLPRPAPGPGPGLATSDPAELATAALVQDVVQTAIDSNTAVTPPPPPPPPPVPPPPGPPPPPPGPPPPPPALQWGRWADVAGAGDTLTQPRSEAALGRAVTVGNVQYALYRGPVGPVTIDGITGAFSFGLDQSFAQYTLGSQTTAATVQGGSLSIDFSHRSFATQLSVTNSVTGLVNISGSGFLRNDGVFTDRTQPGLAIAGATAFDGKSVGYLFDKTVGAGTLSGITLWSRP
jgi:hypothetical protein